MARHGVNFKKRNGFVVSVEGNIGSGKSTFLSYFKSFPEVHTYQEPVSKWCNVEGHNLLDLLYKNPQKWTFAFQSMVQLARLDIVTESTNSRVKMIERSLQNNRYCFLELGKDMGAISDPEYAVLKEYYDWLEKNVDIDLDLIVYLRTSPEVAYNRMRSRNRPEEETIPLSYIKLVHQYYETWLVERKMGPLSAPVLIINADESKDNLLEVYEKNQSQVLGLNL